MFAKDAMNPNHERKQGMKKLLILAISAVFATTMSAQEAKQECKSKQLSKEERVEMDIKRLSAELYLSDKQAENFAKTYREYAKELSALRQKDGCCKQKPEPGKEPDPKALSDSELDKLNKERFAQQKELIDLKMKYYDKFRKDLNARQVEKVLRLKESFGEKPCCGQGQCHGPKGEGFEKQGPRPDFEKHGGPRGHKQGPAPERR